MMTASNTASTAFDIAIVGGGFSGVMVAINAARAARRRIRIVIVERAERVGGGTAYAAQPHDAILNVPAGAMGAFADDPGHFVRSLPHAQADAYLPRHLYGAYLQALLAQTQADGYAVSCLRAEVADLRETADGYALLDGRGRTIAGARVAVLALGAPPPADIVPALPADVRDSPAYIGDPWRFLRAPSFAPTGDIVLAGSGLTALDVIAAFERSGMRNRLQVISRHGRFPLAHAAPGASLPSAPIFDDPRPTTMCTIVAAVRSAVRAAAAQNIDWRNVMDMLRPVIADLWCGLDVVERRRFLRHVRPLFDPHRHRAPPALIARKDLLVGRAQLVVTAARIVQLRANGAAVQVTYQVRGSSERRTIDVAQIINCSGPANDYAGSVEPLIRNLLERGAISVDPTGLGLRTLVDGRIVDAHGAPSNTLFTIGWSMRGTLYETTAVRELREAARKLGGEVARLCDDRQCGA